MSTLEEKFDKFMENHWPHHTKEFGELRGKVELLTKLTLAIAVGIALLFLK